MLGARREQKAKSEGRSSQEAESLRSLHEMTEHKILPKRLFSPGPVPLSFSCELDFSHRSAEFERLFQSCREAITRLTGYANAVFTQGSATSAVETVLSSVLSEDSRIAILVNGEFGRRTARMAEHYTKHVFEVPDLDSLAAAIDTQKPDFCFVVQFETSLSIYNDVSSIQELCKRRGVKLIVDCVSAFPFYEIAEAAFVITSSSKQLGGLPALGIVLFNDLSDDQLIERSDYLSLKKYVEYGLKNQTPHTSMIPQFQSFHAAVCDMSLEDMQNMVRANAAALVSELEHCVLNESIAPVVTFPSVKTSELIGKLEDRGVSVYHNRVYMNECIQIGCFNYTDSTVYTRLNQVLRELNADGRYFKSKDTL